MPWRCPPICPPWCCIPNRWSSGWAATAAPPSRTLRTLLAATLAERGLSQSSICALTSVDAKADEQGLIDLAAELGVDFVTYPAP